MALQHALQAHFRALAQVRRGVCLLNAGQFDLAAAAFSNAVDLDCTDQTLPAYMAACLIGQGRAGAAADLFSRQADAMETGRIEASHGQEDEVHRARQREVFARIRQALAQAADGRVEAAVETLRQAVSLDPECAEAHFQLGTLLTSLERFAEAELRFTQAINIERDHKGALVSLALCCGVAGAPGHALPHLQRAQARNPHDAHIGLLLAQAAEAVRQQGQLPRVKAAMPWTTPMADAQGIEELSRVIEAEPDFVDAFLSISIGEVDQQVFAVLLRTLQAALDRQPEHAELHFHCGRILNRLGRRDDAIVASEQAVRINPRFTRALIELARLYQQTDRARDATTRLEQAIEAGAEYADVYYLLGNLYKEQGEIMRARTAYRQALMINSQYDAARKALAALPA